MAQDKFNAAQPGKKLAKLRATRLSASTDPNLAALRGSGHSSVPERLLASDDPQSDSIKAIQTPSAFAESQKPKIAASEQEQTIDIPDNGETGESQATHVAMPEQAQNTAPSEVSKTNEEAFDAEEVENLQTHSLAAVEQDQETMLLEALPATPKPDHLDEVEKQQTRQLPTIVNTPTARPTKQAPSADANDLEKQQTLLMPALPGEASVHNDVAETKTTVLAAIRLPFLQRLFAGGRNMISTGLVRLQEPQPEGLATRGLQVVKPGISLGLFPLLTLTNASGLILISISYYLGQFGRYDLELSFLLGLLILFVPNLLRLLSPATLRIERICLLCGLGLSFYVVALMMSPLHLSSFDEFLHWVTSDNLSRTGHLFSINSMLPVSPYYPGLEIITNAISSLTGLNTFFASIPLIVASRFVLVLSLFLFYEKITSSSRMAGIATIIYMLNPHFIFFDSMFSYETLALPFTICLFYILARYENIGGEHRWIIFTSWMVLIAVTLTHHMTDYVTDGLLLLWAAISFFTAASRKTRIHLVTLAIFGAALALAYALLVNGNPVWSYLSAYFNTAFTELGHIITGTSSSRALFSGTGGTPSPIWDRLLMTGSVAIVAFSLPFGLLTLWRLHRRNALPLTLGIFALTYPLAQAFRFTAFGSEIADRSAAFLFLAVAYVLTLLIAHFWPTRKLSKKAIALITCAMSVVLLGGVILDAGAGYTSLPGPYMVGADSRSIEPEGIDAALWAQAYLGPDNRIGTDRTNQMLMSTYGDQRVVTQLYDLVDVSPLFYSTQFDNADIGLLRSGKVQYLVVDLRLSTSVPALGFYFVNDEPEANHITTPISRSALTKFDSVPQMNRLFDSGNIVIYDTRAFLSGPGP